MIEAHFSIEINIPNSQIHISKPSTHSSCIKKNSRKKYSDFSLNKWKLISKGLRRSGRTNSSFDNTASFIHDYTRIPIRITIDVSKVENYLTSVAVGPKISIIRWPTWRRIITRVAPPTFITSCFLRAAQFAIGTSVHHTTHRATRPASLPPTPTNATATATDAVTTNDARNDGIKNNGGKSMRCLYHREFTAARAR